MNATPFILTGFIIINNRWYVNSSEIKHEFTFYHKSLIFTSINRIFGDNNFYRLNPYPNKLDKFSVLPCKGILMSNPRCKPGGKYNLKLRLVKVRL
jgi:hypothetical protein